MYLALYVFNLFFIKLFSHLPGIIESFSVWINSYTSKYTYFEFNVILIWLDLMGDVATCRGQLGIFSMPRRYIHICNPAEWNNIEQAKI